MACAWSTPPSSSRCCTPAVVSVIPGGQGVAEMESNLQAAKAVIPQALWDDLRAEGLLRADAPTG
jgi:D-threo-aldose 1-dehydrogenase